MLRSKYLAAAMVIACASTLWLTARADETSTRDKLRILYSNHFTFTNDGAPLMTIEIMSGQREVRLSAADGLWVRPDGDGGSRIEAGEAWTVRVESARPAKIRAWTIVARLEADDERGAQAATRRWEKAGFSPQRFEVGTVFGVDGEVIDTREVLIGVAPVKPAQGGAKARAISQRYNVETSVHHELVARPEGVIVATDGKVVVRNPSVIWFDTRSSEGTIEVADVIAGGGGSQLETARETRRYFGSIYVTVGSDGKLVAVNAVSADRLLAGLVPAEIYPVAHSEALAAQAIAARTELLQKIGTRHLTDPFSLCSSQHCQVYAGAGREHPRTTRAVRDTRGVVLLRDGGGLVDARYSAACGGHGEHNDHIWGGAPDPSLRGHLDMPAGARSAAAFAGGINEGNIAAFLDSPPEDSYCGATRFGRGRFRWTEQISAKELTKRVAAAYPEVGAVRALQPLERGVSGRIRRLRIRGSRGQAVATGDLHIRRLLGGLRSSLFVARPIGDPQAPSAFEFRGAGFGHGVGMCQIGAIGMAEAGIAHRAILQHYYPGTRLKRLYF